MSASSILQHPSLKLPSRSVSSNDTCKISAASTSSHHHYRIEDERQSESALLLFARHVDTGKCIVIKRLREYKDTRYSLETLSKRQQCLLEALQRNRVFSSELYIGLARIYDENLTQGIVCTDEPLKTPTPEQLDPHAEYVLLMEKLPEDRRLDYLLETTEKGTQCYYALSLARRVAYMHNHLVFSSAIKDGMRWGTYKHLQQKFMHNLELLDLLLSKVHECQCDSYKQLANRLIYLRDTAKQVAMQSHYRKCLEQRVVEEQIKYCHGDLKSPHIWIMPHDDDKEPAQPIKILDAIDFNPMYNHIDILSDFAMLVADIHARTQSFSLVDEMVDCYLKQTDQDNERARAVLDYYVVEKAIVGTAISLLYDNLPELGLSFLKVAEVCLKSMCSVAV